MLYFCARIDRYFVSCTGTGMIRSSSVEFCTMFDFFQENSKILAELTKLRAEKAAILNFENHVAFILDMRMAKKPDTVGQFLTNLAGRLFGR